MAISKHGIWHPDDSYGPYHIDLGNMVESIEDVLQEMEKKIEEAQND